MIRVRRPNLLCIAVFSLIFCDAAYGKDRVHFLIPGGAGGGWDMTARAVGDSLSRSGIIEMASYENLSGGGGRVFAFTVRLNLQLPFSAPVKSIGIGSIKSSYMK